MSDAAPDADALAEEVKTLTAKLAECREIILGLMTDEEKIGTPPVIIQELDSLLWWHDVDEAKRLTDFYSKRVTK